ncbi:MAG: hypothetical protein CM15mP23_15650 [Cryomorphaceae bacterium]|nr:MAG: hypothetical protein CM15mP23_15650 [Cryomorphaceae bacterium]
MTVVIEDAAWDVLPTEGLRLQRLIKMVTWLVLQFTLAL